MGAQGSQRHYRVDPALMARVCRKLAQDLRKEHASGMGPIPLTGLGNEKYKISRDLAAKRFDEQAGRWEHESRTGELNMVDRDKIVID